MSLELVRFLALTFGSSITAASRPGLTFFGVQLVCAVLVGQELVVMTPGLAWLVSLPALIVAGVLAVLETASRHDPDIAAILRDLQVDKLTGAFGAFSAALLFTALGLPEEESMALAGTVDPGGMLQATSAAVASDHGTVVDVGVVGGAVVLSGGLTWFRGQLLEFIDDFELSRLFARFETGGVLAALLLLPLLPLVAASFLVVFALFLAAAALLTRAARRWSDDRDRIACASCGHRIRPEASLCPKCRTSCQPTRALDQAHQASVGLAAAWRELARSRAAD